MCFLRIWGEMRMEEREGMFDCRQLLSCCSQFPSLLLMDRTFDSVFILSKLPHTDSAGA